MVVDNQSLLEFADYLDQHQPTAVQLELSSEYNWAVFRALSWAAKQAREKAARGY